MEQSLIKRLADLNIQVDSLSKREIDALTQINNLFDEFERTDSELKTRLAQNKFTKTLISKKINYSRQTLYKNPTILRFVEYCVEKAEKISNYLPQNAVDKEKYQQLKEENELILLNVVDNALKDNEIERLSLENKEKDNRINELTLKIETLNKEISSLKRKTYN